MYPHLQKRRIRKVFLLALAGALFVVLPACSKPAKAPASSSGGGQKQAVATAPTKTEGADIKQEAPPVYSYNTSGRRDPFAPIIQKEVKKATTGDRPPLERYNIAEYKLSGIVWGGFGYNAILEGPDGKGYFIKVGTILGPNRGVVKKITQTTMVIEEKFKTYSGELQHKEIVVELRKSQEATP